MYMNEYNEHNFDYKVFTFIVYKIQIFSGGQYSNTIKLLM